MRALRAVAQQLLRPIVGQPHSGEALTPEPESLLADEPVRDFSFIGLFNGAPDLSERSEEIPLSCRRGTRWSSTPGARTGWPKSST